MKTNIPMASTVVLALIVAKGAFAVAAQAGAKPTVVSTIPANGSIGVSPLIESFSVTFSKTMNTNVCGAGTTNWVGAAGTTCTWSTDGLTMTVTRRPPVSPLVQGSSVQVTLNAPGFAVLRDLEGNYLDQFSFSFRIYLPPTELLKVPANPTAGFHWSYYLYIPSVVKTPAVLFVEPNNTGRVSDDPAVHDNAALQLMNYHKMWADDLGTPYLVPTFLRPATGWLTYTHALDRDSLLTQVPGLVRIDLQLIAMIDDARAKLAARNITVDPKVWMFGFSASASFTNRFTMLHPDRVLAASYGSGGSFPMVPVSTWKGRTLRYPVGVADLQQLTGSPFDEAAFRGVPVQTYIGDQDLDDALDYRDGYDVEDAELIKQVFGGPPAYERWPAAEAAYNSVHSSCQFAVFPGLTHNYPSWKFIKDFYENNRTPPFAAPGPKPLSYKICFPHVASFDGWETEIGLTNTSEAAIRGILRAYPATGGPALQSLEIVIPASGREEVTVGQSFVNARQIAYMVFESDSGFVAGYTRFNQPGNRVSLAVTSGVDRGWFAKMEKLGWTGIAFVNLNAGDSTVSLSAWSADGSQVGGKVVVLKSGEKFVGMVEQLFGSDLSNARYFRFTSDRKVIAFTVSGSADGQMLDGLGSLGRYVSQ